MRLDEIIWRLSNIDAYLFKSEPDYLHGDHEAMMIAIDAFRNQMCEWVSVHDALPADGEYVLAYCQDRAFTPYAIVSFKTAQHFKWGAKYCMDLEGNGAHATHWMPLPKQPEGGKE